MTTWKIFEGNCEPHDGLERLPDPPNWRVFKDEQMRQQQKGATFKARPEEIELVNAALYLRRPLLITGKPGTGKTSLAYAVAYELKLGEVLYWPITTRTTLKSGLYNYDAIGRLQDSQQNKDHTLKDISKYIRLGPLGTALLPTPNPKKPRILLIDEIDKSDIDLPNDLLHVFEEGRYRIPELERINEVLPVVPVGTAYENQEPAEIHSGQVQCNAFPFVILTSNGERDFPPPFLRRCIRLDMREPNEDELAEIVRRHLTDADVLAEVTPLIKAFLQKRDDEAKDLATDQLLNAIYLLRQAGIPNDEKARNALRDRLLKPLSGSEA
ncbi:MAG: MoxR family ATPase [Leptolyngbyaceae cyanobacterium SM1_4_3]|nr:MoxR family ATPase [Leptolyngbyaceae cyanobacterium SM1_4_3]